jgi:hypothetical protein
MSSKRKLRFTNYNQQSRMVAGVCVPDGDYDELLREAVRIALRTDMNPTHDDWDDLYDRIRGLMDAYIHSPEGAGQDTSALMSRLAACVADVVPLSVRRMMPLAGYGPSTKQNKPQASKKNLKNLRAKPSKTESQPAIAAWQYSSPFRPSLAGHCCGGVGRGLLQKMPANSTFAAMREITVVPVTWAFFALRSVP